MIKTFYRPYFEGYRGTREGKLGSNWKCNEPVKRKTSMMKEREESWIPEMSH